VAAQRGAEPRVGGVVEGREAVVEQVNARLADQRAGDREALALAAGKVAAALSHGGRQALRQRGNEIGGLRHIERVPEFLVDGVGAPEAQVAGDAAGEQPGLLRDEPDHAPQRRQRQLAHVDAAHLHAATGHVEQPGDQVQQRRFTRAGGTGDGDRLAGCDAQVDATQRRCRSTRVLKGHGPELDATVLPGDGTRHRPGGGRRRLTHR